MTPSRFRTQIPLTQQNTKIEDLHTRATQLPIEGNRDHQLLYSQISDIQAQLSVTVSSVNENFTLSSSPARYLSPQCSSSSSSSSSSAWLGPNSAVRAAGAEVSGTSDAALNCRHTLLKTTDVSVAVSEKIAELAGKVAANEENEKITRVASQLLAPFTDSNGIIDWDRFDRYIFRSGCFPGLFDCDRRIAFDDRVRLRLDDVDVDEEFPQRGTENPEQQEQQKKFRQKKGKVRYGDEVNSEQNDKKK